MTNDTPANKVMATVESARVGRRHEEGSRFFALVSMPITGNEQLVLTLMKNINNPVELGFGIIQPQLLPVPETPETETVDMVVNGEPAKVQRQKTNGNRRPLDVSGHAFVENPETPGLCGSCHHRPENEVHDVPPWGPDDKPLPHSFHGNSRDNQCSWCHLGKENELHEGQPDAELSPEAQALIDEAKATAEV